MQSLDTEFVRAQFPAFSEPSLAGQAYFENAGGSYVCQPVYDRLTRFYRERKVQPYSVFEPGRVGGEEMDEAQRRLAAMMNVATDEVSFGPSTTQNTYVLANAVRQWMRPGSGNEGAIIVTDQDHEANSGPWRRLNDDGIEIREWKLDPASGRLEIDSLAALLDERVRLVCFPHCSNIIAEINDVAAISKLAHDAGAFVCVDGVSYAGHGLPDVSALGADIYLFSTYKTYGPHQGVLVMRRALMETLPNQGHWFNADAPGKRFTPAGPDHAQIAASAGIADYFDQLYAHHFTEARNAAGRAAAVHDLMRAQEIRLLQPLLDYLKDRNDVRLLGPDRAETRAPTVAVDLNRPGRDVAAELAPHGIMAGGGDFYGARPINAAGYDAQKGVLRMSFVHYTSKAELDHLIRVLDHVL